MKKGSLVCDAQSVPRDKLEEFVIKAIETVVLSPSHIRKLIRLTNEEIEQQTGSLDGQLSSIENELNDVRRKLDKWAEAYESSKIDTSHFADRIKGLNSRRDVLEAERASLLSQTRGPAEVLTAKEVIRYVKNLGGVLDRNTIAEQKALLQSFVDKVEVDWPSVEITYRLPVPASTHGGGGNGGGVGVLPSFQPGPPPAPDQPRLRVGVTGRRTCEGVTGRRRLAAPYPRWNRERLRAACPALHPMRDGRMPPAWRRPGWFKSSNAHHFL